MGIMLGKHIVAAIITAVVTSHAQGAVLKSISGTVMLNKGDGFRSVSDVTPVSEGDRVLVRGRGSAQIEYGEGCSVQISANQSAVVLPSHACNKSSTHSLSTNSAVSLKDTPASINSEETSDYQLYVAGGVLFTAGAVATAIEVGKDKPASP
jgi:hypothetical protein